MEKRCRLYEYVAIAIPVYRVYGVLNNIGLLSTIIGFLIIASKRVKNGFGP